MPFFGGVNNYKIRGSNNYGGTSAAANLSGGINNLLLGNQAGFYLENGSDNVILGAFAGPDEFQKDVGSIVLIGASAFFTKTGGEFTGAGVGIGESAALTAVGNIVIGAEAGTQNAGDANVFIGLQVPGPDASAAMGSTVAIGANAFVNDNGAVAVGAAASVNAPNGTAVGSLARAGASAGELVSSVAIGRAASAEAHSIAIGDTAEGSAAGAVVIGNDAYVGAAGPINSTAIGEGCMVQDGGGVGSVVVGAGSVATQGVVIGYNLDNSLGFQSVVIGENLSTIDEGSSVVIGSNLDAADETETGSVLIGQGGTPLIYAPLGGLSIAMGTTAQRSADATRARVRYNTDLGCVEFFDPTLAKWLAFNRQIDFSNTAAAVGTVTAGAATYTNRQAFGTLNGDVFTFQIRFGWSAHTGAGDLKITGFPFTNIATTPAVLAVSVNGLTLTSNNMVQAYMAPNTTEVQPLQLVSGNATVIALDTVVTYFMLAGSYKIQLP